MSPKQTVFDQEYQKLNLHQKEAVDTTEGPVIVIAGAGTGKTQTIALRIANILLTTQTNPANILCLTFTESGVDAMRKRLLTMIGPDAYKIRLHTFHSLSNSLVLQNPEAFGLHPASQAASDLDRADILQTCIQGLPDASKLKPWGDPLLYLYDVTSAIQSLKREGFTPSSFLNLLNQHQTALVKLQPFYQQLKTLRATKGKDVEITHHWQTLNLDPSLSPSLHALLQSQFNLQKNGFFAKPTDFKAALVNILEDLQDNLPKLLELQKIYLDYQKGLQAKFLYDYDDMILMLQHKLKSDPGYLLSLQEQIQYILVDEYQDTNSAQNEIIYSLASYFDQPNLFVVGDDDQSIFRFQGTSLENVYAFYLKYHPKVIALQHNYRSQAHVISSANQVIQNNLTRISNYLPDLDKSLLPATDIDPNPINVFSAPTPIQENYWIAQKIGELLQAKTKPSEIAILTRTNNQAQEICQFLDQQNLKYFLESGQDIFQDSLIQQLLILFSAILDSSPLLISRVLALPLCQVNSLALFRYNREKFETKKIKQILHRLALCQKDLVTSTAHGLFLKTLERFQILKYIQSLPNNYLNLTKLKTLSDEILNLSGSRTSQQVFALLAQMQSQQVSLSSFLPEEFKQDSLRIMTVHKAKGLEFEHVFLPSCNSKTWGNSGAHSKLKLPPGILPLATNSLTAADNHEDERRLFYVALTRAKNQVYLTYSQSTADGKPQQPSLYISEISPDLLDYQKSAVDHQTALTTFFTPNPKPNISDKFQVYLSDYLKNKYVLTATDLNSYLLCPFCFYQQKILRVPTEKSKHVLYGTAIHDTLSQYYKNVKQQPTLQNLLDFFRRSLHPHQFINQAEYQESLSRGEAALVAYYPHLQQEQFSEVLVEQNFNSPQLFFQKIPITGKIDKITLNPNQVTLTDFKTGNPDSKHKELNTNPENFGPYYRQLLFYWQLLKLSHKSNLIPTNLAIEFVELSTQKKQFISKNFVPNPEHLKVLQQEIQDIYQKIIALDFFTIGDSCPDPHHLHLLFK